MKTVITSLVIGALAWIGTAPAADARPRHSGHVYISGYLPCGTPVYRERYFAGYDCYGRPIWKTRVVRTYVRPAYRPRPVPCPPPSYGGRVVFHGSFGY